ncbi:hypothetical protein WJX73_006211 [Symbiochloris irregularis]|uniref:Uncharacterized protein n=1 Tax=Symbiochloris irregularis TaxID=706552 RepID=A0AAW1PC68_9CHLO
MQNPDEYPAKALSKKASGRHPDRKARQRRRQGAGPAVCGGEQGLKLVSATGRRTGVLFRLGGCHGTARRGIEASHARRAPCRGRELVEQKVQVLTTQPRRLLDCARLVATTPPPLPSHTLRQLQHPIIRLAPIAELAAAPSFLASPTPPPPQAFTRSGVLLPCGRRTPCHMGTDACNLQPLTRWPRASPCSTSETFRFAEHLQLDKRWRVARIPAGPYFSLSR